MIAVSPEASSSTLRKIVDSLTMVVWMTDPSGKFIYLHLDTAEYRDATSCQVEDWLQFVHPDDVQALGPIFRQAMALRRPYQFEYRLIRSDGSIHWVRSTAAPRTADDGAFLGYIGAISDSTPLHNALKKLEQSDTSLRLMLENSSDLLSHHAPDTGNYLYASPSSEALIGYTPGELMGASCYDGIHPDDRERVRDEIRRQTQGEPDSRLIEFRVRHKNGHYVWMGAKARVLLDLVTLEKLGAVVVSRDISAERKAREDLRRSEERFRGLANLSSDWYWETNQEGRFTYVSDGLEQLFGTNVEDVIGKTRIERAADKAQPGLLEYLRRVEQREPFKDIEYTAYVESKGTVRHALLSGEPVYENGSFVGYRGVGRNVTEQIETRRRLEHLAKKDTLTGLSNRTFFVDSLQALLDDLQDGISVAVLFIDLDRFKEVNDTLGHPVGDDLLRAVAKRLSLCMHPRDLLARLGGDEFVVAAICPKGNDSAGFLVERLRLALAQPVVVGEQEVFVRASIGVSMYPQDGKTKEALLQNADIAMYRAKDAGRNGYCFYAQEMAVQMKGRMTIENSLHRALDRNEFELHYQPRIKLPTLEVVGMEALIRWNHPQLGRVSPADFIPLAEERGFIGAIGNWVLHEACRYARTLIDNYGRPYLVSVNVSARQLRDDSIIREVRAALSDSGLSPQMLELELTETALVDNVNVSEYHLAQLKALGVSLAVDDFGTGYSGLAYLGHFPFDVLKLDRSFINRVGSSGRDNRRVIRAFIDMAHALELPVVAEGVETEEVLRFLTEAGCDEAQGYLLSRPLAATDLEAFLRGKK